MSTEAKPPRRRKKSPVFVARWEVMDDLGVATPETIDRRIARGEIPPPVRRVSNNRPVWLRTEWKQWLGQRNQS
jgi:predicted DNA-binding transcriptional regulator AlpA